MTTTNARIVATYAGARDIADTSGTSGDSDLAAESIATEERRRRDEFLADELARADELAATD